MATVKSLQTQFSNEVVQTELSPKRLRTVLNGVVVADSKRVLLLREKGHTPVYYFPEDDVRMDLMRPTDQTTHCPRKGDASYYTITIGEKTVENGAWYYPKPHASEPGLGGAPDLRGYVAFYWNKMDAWFEEDEEVFVHARDPYKRVDVMRSTRHVQVVIGGVVVADSHSPVLLFETGMPTRYYLPKFDVRIDLLRPSDRVTRCPYKGEARYYSVAVDGKVAEDVAWYYRYPNPEAGKIANHIAFYTERVDATYLDGEELPKPKGRYP